MKPPCCFPLVLLAILAFTPVQADMGSIALKKGVRINDPPIRRMFSSSTDAYLQEWIIEGPIDTFDHDLLVRNSAPPLSD